MLGNSFGSSGMFFMWSQLFTEAGRELAHIEKALGPCSFENFYGSWTGACGPNWSCRVNPPREPKAFGSNNFYGSWTGACGPNWSCRVRMCSLPLCIFKKGDKFIARIKVKKKNYSGPCRSTVLEASTDLVRLRAEHPSPVVRQLPRYVYRHCGFRKGYRAKRSIGAVCKVAPPACDNRYCRSGRCTVGTGE